MDQPWFTNVCFDQFARRGIDQRFRIQIFVCSGIMKILKIAKVVQGSGIEGGAQAFLNITM